MKGFTLLEVMFVFAIVGAIAAIGSISWTQIDALFRLRATADQARSFFQQAREMAIANQKESAYQVSLEGNVMLLASPALEIERFILPNNVQAAPNSFTIVFAPVTGAVSGCNLPCQFIFTTRGENEIVTIYENKIVQ